MRGAISWFTRQTELPDERPISPSAAKIHAKIRQDLITVTVLAAAYFAAGTLVLLASMHSGVVVVWPASGVALAGLLLRGSRMWPAILVGAFFVSVTTTGSVASSLVIAAGNTLEALVGLI